MKSLPGQAVFVDPSGRRRRFARRAGIVVAVPAVGYLLLLVSTMLGGPSVSTPLVPIPDAVRPPAARQTVVPKTDASPTSGPSAAETTGPSGSPTRSPSGPTSAPSSGTVAPVGVSSSPPATGVPATTVPPSTPPTTVPTPTHPTQASNTAKPGRTNSPTARPTHTPKNPKTP